MSPVDVIRREIERARSGTRQALRAVLKGLTLTTKIQRVSGEGLDREDLEEMELFQHFGFTSAPPAGSEYIPLPLGGRTSASVVIGTEHGDFRFVLDNQGETCVYNQWGDFAHFKKDRSIHVKAQEKVFAETKVFRVEASQEIQLISPLITMQASTKIVGTTPLVDLSQNLTAAGLTRVQNFTVGIGGVGGTATMVNGSFNYQNVITTYTGGTIRQDGRDIGSTHTHNETGSVTLVPNA